MDYFAYSPFWDTKSNNNVLRTQRRVENPTYGHAEEKIELNAFKSGFEYIISHAQPPDLFVIQKREVENSGKRDRVTGSWFILHEKIYQSPSIYDVVSARLRNASFLISKTLNSLSECHPSSNPRTTTVWRSLPPETEIENTTSKEIENDLINTADDIDGNEGKNKKKENSSTSTTNTTTFDWNLYHSLQTTRNSIESLNKLSKTKKNLKPNPIEEIKSIENQLSSQFGIGLQQQQQQQQFIQGQVNGINRTESIKSINTPINFNLAGIGNVISPSSIGFGNTIPNLNNFDISSSSPKILNNGISPNFNNNNNRTISLNGNSPLPNTYFNFN
nr:uncharacterized protein I206_04404 [Kwoniella pini CBS 10737]OCF49876.1 hypothetical protein I206_04404 [Kwoniella pini CBS 10737]